MGLLVIHCISFVAIRQLGQHIAAPAETQRYRRIRALPDLKVTGQLHRLIRTGLSYLGDARIGTKAFMIAMQAGPNIGNKYPGAKTNSRMRP